jgi:hypothetical protein
MVGAAFAAGMADGGVAKARLPAKERAGTPAPLRAFAELVPVRAFAVLAPAASRAAAVAPVVRIVKSRGNLPDLT